jgi:hypothetical protein
MLDEKLNCILQAPTVQVHELANPQKMKLSAQAAVLFLISHAFAATEPRIQVALALQHPVNGASTAADERIIILFSLVDGSTGPQVAEWNNGSTSAALPKTRWK